MQLEAIRTVLKNEVNEVTVCLDLNRKNGEFHTVITISNPQVRKRVAGMVAVQGLFAGNHDFEGSFTRGDTFNLVFLYRQEETLVRMEPMYATTFVRRRQIAENLLVALAETQITGSVGLLLLHPRNINITTNLTIYFNYFLDFQDWEPSLEETQFYRVTAQTIFKFISADYEVRYGEVESFPIELQVFFKKTQAKGFLSFSNLLSFVKGLPDKLTEPNIGWRKVVNRVRGVFAWLGAHSLTFFVLGVLALTIVYTANQLITRISYSNATKENTTYRGMETIGEVQLGDETV